jgi:hypothetical protein
MPKPGYNPAHPRFWTLLLADLSVLAGLCWFIGGESAMR